MDFIFTYLRSINLVSICLRIVLALLIGGLLGLERGRKNRPAGFRTYMLVCLGSALVMMTNQYVYQYYGVSDPVRMGAQVISGIGFLGAGTIMVTGRSQIKGITTAAGLWTAACCGLAIGVGFYEGAVLGGLSIYIIMASMRKLDAYIHSHAREIELYVEFSPGGLVSDFVQYARENGLDVLDIQLKKNKMAKEGGLCAIISLETVKKRSHADLISLISAGPGVAFMEEL